MTTGIESDLKELLTKHLPQATSDALQATSDALQERLRQADADKITVERQKEQISGLNTQIKDLQAQVNTATEELKKHDALAAREAAVSEKERNADIAALKVQLEAAQGNTQFAKDVALGLVRNSEFRRTVYDNENRSDPIIPPGATYPQGSANSTVSRSTNTTDTVG